MQFVRNAHTTNFQGNSEAPRIPLKSLDSKGQVQVLKCCINIICTQSEILGVSEAPRRPHKNLKCGSLMAAKMTSLFSGIFQDLPLAMAMGERQFLSRKY